MRSGSQIKVSEESILPLPCGNVLRLWRQAVLLLLAGLLVLPPALADDLEKIAGGRFEAPMAAPTVSADIDVAPGTPADAPHYHMESVPAYGASETSCIQRDDSGRFMGWMDYQHCTFSGRTIATARWVDDLFGDWYDDQASMLVRAISEVTEVEGDGLNIKFRLRASAALPNAKQRLRLVVTDDSDRDENVANQDVLSQINKNNNSISAALRWIPFARAGFKTDFDLGVRGINPPDVFTRMRVRNNWSISRNAIMRLGQTFRYGSDSHGSSITQLDFERVMDENSVARFSSAYQYQQDDHQNGFSWGHGVSLSHALGSNKSLSYGVSLNGHTQPNWRGENYGPWVAFRSSFLRSWLFYELEPRLTYYRDRDWDSVASIILRLEIQLGKK